MWRFRFPDLYQRVRDFSFGNLRASFAASCPVRYPCLHCCDLCDNASMKPIEATREQGTCPCSRQDPCRRRSMLAMLLLALQLSLPRERAAWGSSRACLFLWPRRRRTRASPICWQRIAGSPHWTALRRRRCGRRRTFRLRRAPPARLRIGRRDIRSGWTTRRSAWLVPPLCR